MAQGSGARVMASDAASRSPSSSPTTTAPATSATAAAAAVTCLLLALLASGCTSVSAKRTGTSSVIREVEREGAKGR